MKLVPLADPVLWESARQMTPEDREIHRHTFDELREYMTQVRGAGIALPQIGLGLCGFITRYEKFPLVINPEFSAVTNDHTTRPEGSLSKPGWSTFVRRADKILAHWIDLEGKRHSLEIEGIEARVFQHCCDYLNGTPIFPKPPRVHASSGTP